MSVMYTTVDNPYSPFEKFMDWFNFDHQKKYNTNEKIDRIVDTIKQEKTAPENIPDDIYEEAFNRLIRVDPFHLYQKVTESDYDKNGMRKPGDAFVEERAKELRESEVSDATYYDEL